MLCSAGKFIVRAHGQVTIAVCRTTFVMRGFLVSFQFPVYVFCFVCLWWFSFKGNRKYLFPEARVNIGLLAALVYHGSETISNCLYLFFCHLGLAFNEVDKQSENKATIPS